ncbi:DUF2637 domain-containing protein [Streptomyces luteogriseus]|uniref:DUF2637 domain-containing protein n=1 Tax=Streptomyces TaxID=1883 RepID=UPI0004C4C665|nr:DUF2637 domain-containing protein [Streptomyces sp. NRRL S-475]
MHRVLIGVVVAGAVIIAGIGFAGSYAAVRELALKKGFGNFSYVFPIGIDAGICVLLALDLLLTWIRIPFPLLRQTAWLLTAATIAFNGAAAWPDPLGVGMHAVIPILFVVSVEAARHAIGRIADITADKHMEGVRLTRWLLSPVPTFLLWRRMKLWELRSYEQVIKLEQERLVYQARLRSRFGRAWRRKAPVESLMPLRLARYGVPLAETAPAGLAAAGIEPALIPPAPQQALDAAAPQALDAAAPQALDEAAASARAGGGPAGSAQPSARRATTPPGEQRPEFDGSPAAEYADAEPEPDQSPWFNTPREVAYQGGYDPAYDPERYAQWFAEQQQAEQYLDQPQEDPSPEDTGSFPIPVGPGRTRELGEGGGTPGPGAQAPGSPPVPEPDEESYYQVFKQSINGSYPTPRELIDNVEAEFGIGLPPEDAKRMVNRFTNRHNAELEEDHIA